MSSQYEVSAVSHDYFTQQGGAERVAKVLIRLFAPDRILTAAFNRTQLDKTALPGTAEVESSFLQRFSKFRHDPRWAFPLLPLVWRLHRPVSQGVLLCSSSGWAHGARASSSATKIVYCHNPARWLYQPADFFKDKPRALRWAIHLASPALRKWDRKAARSADLYVANSRAVADRVKKAYGIDSIVIHPPIGLNTEGPVTEVQEAPQSFFLTVGRRRGYKNTQILVESFAQRPDLILLCVGFPERGMNISENVIFVGGVDDAQLRWLYRTATALISVAAEDFGLTPLEANAHGTPALLVKNGGFLDSLQEGVSGMYIADATTSAVLDALDSFPSHWDKDLIKSHAAKFSEQEFKRKMDDLIHATVNKRIARNTISE